MQGTIVAEVTQKDLRSKSNRVATKGADRMKISARNQLKGTISAVKEGAVNGVVSVDIGGQVVKCDITMEAIKDLALAEGKPATVVIKATNVLIASGSEPLKNISARNQFVGTISKVKKGAVNGHVGLDIMGGNKITASITNEAIETLGLVEGGQAVAIVKATDVLVAID